MSYIELKRSPLFKFNSSTKSEKQAEKDVLNILFLGVPLLNIILPFIYKSFAFVWSADMVRIERSPPSPNPT